MLPTIPLGRSGLSVSRIGLGCMGMSEFYGDAPEAECKAAFDQAIELGMTFIDTADMYGYGANERLVGGFIKGRRDNVVLATKFGILRDPARPHQRDLNGSPEYVKSACDASLIRLGVDVIDLYYAHRLDPSVPLEETVGAMAELVHAGKVRAIGLSEVSPAQLARAEAVHPIAAVQSEFSLWSRDTTDVLETCRAAGTTFVPYSPLGRGLLARAVKGMDDLAAGDFRRNLPRFQKAALERNTDLAKAVEAMAHELSATPAQLALAWVLAQGAHVAPIPGTRKASRVDENAAAATLALSAETLDRLQTIAGQADGPRYPEASMSRLLARSEV